MRCRTCAVGWPSLVLPPIAHLSDSLERQRHHDQLSTPTGSPPVPSCGPSSTPPSASSPTYPAEAITVADIAAAANMTAAAVYYHFPSKERVLLEGLQSFTRDYLAEVRRLSRETVDGTWCRDHRRRGHWSGWRCTGWPRPSTSRARRAST